MPYKGPAAALRAVASGEAATARVFAPKPGLAHGGEPWDAAAWARRDKPALLEAARRWMAFEGRRPANVDAVWRAARTGARR